MNTSSQIHADSMLHRQSDSAVLTPLPLSVTGEGIRALEGLRDAVRLHGAEALRSAQQRLETLQECFLSIVHRRLSSAGISPVDKLSLHLADDASLSLHTAAGDAHLQELLTADGELQALFTQMHTLALTAQGIEHLNAAQDTVAASSVRYRACIKGALSHFYLR